VLCGETSFAIRVGKLAHGFSHLHPWDSSSWASTTRPNWPELMEEPEFVYFPDLVYFDGMKETADSGRI
jgi:hypothetical protein